MTITNPQAGTSVHEIEAGIFRISTPVHEMPGGFTFNQFLIVDEAPLLYHTGQRKLFPLVREAVEHVLGDVAKLRYVGFSHLEADESGALNEWLEAAPAAQAVCGELGAMLSVGDYALRPPHALREDDWLSLGTKRVRWLATPHLPHNWECGHLFEDTTRTLFCGDLFTHAGATPAALTDSDPIGPAEALRRAMPGSFALEAGTRANLEKLAATAPTTLAIMHGSSFRGDGGRVLREYAGALGL